MFRFVTRNRQWKLPALVGRAPILHILAAVAIPNRRNHNHILGQKINQMMMGSSFHLQISGLAGLHWIQFQNKLLRLPAPPAASTAMGKKATKNETTVDIILQQQSPSSSNSNWHNRTFAGHTKPGAEKAWGQSKTGIPRNPVIQC